MKIFLITLAVFAISLLGMAVGTIVGRRRLRGSCGGLAGLKDEQGRSMCDTCTTPSEECTGNASHRPPDDHGCDTASPQSDSDRSASPEWNRSQRVSS